LRDLRQGIGEFNELRWHGSNLHEEDARIAGGSTSADWL